MLDLANIAILRVGGTAGGRAAEFRRARHLAVRSIVWHAAGLHDELWSNNGDGEVLNEPAIRELLDRRLRTVERMLLQINASAGNITAAASGRGPWLDRSRVRVFEYPYFERRFVTPADIGHIWTTFTPDVVQYNWFDHDDLRVRFDNEPGPLGSVTISTSWPPISDDTYNRNVTSGSIALALDELFKSNLDVWKRAWLFCDHSIAAAQLEALRFALLRRGGTDFDSLVRPKSPYIGAIMPGVNYDTNDQPFVPDDDIIWRDGTSTGPSDTGVFDSLVVPFRDLQVGDHCILWNHHLYVSVTKGPWRLENALITETDVVTTNWDKEDKVDLTVFMTPNADAMVLSGFGETHPYKAFLGALLEQVQAPFEAAFDVIPTGSETFFTIPESAQPGLVVRWNPYTSGIDGVCWWIFMPRVSFANDGSPWPDKVVMQKAISYSVIDGPDRGSGYVSPPTTLGARDLIDGAFYPMFLPEVNGRAMNWNAYFSKRRDNQISGTTKLRRKRLTASDIPGFFARGKNQPIQIIRPRVRP